MHCRSRANSPPPPPPPLGGISCNAAHFFVNMFTTISSRQTLRLLSWLCFDSSFFWSPLQAIPWGLQWLCCVRYGCTLSSRLRLGRGESDATLLGLLQLAIVHWPPGSPPVHSTGTSTTLSCQVQPISCKPCNCGHPCITPPPPPPPPPAG